MRSHSRRGSAIIEFALGWSVLWLLFSGVYQFGYAFYIYNSLLTSVANAAELGSKLDYDTAHPSAYTTSLTNMVLYGDTVAGTKTLVPHLTSANVSVNVTLNNGMPMDLTVSISNYQLDAIFKQFTFNGKPRATTVYAGRVICTGC